MEWFTLDVLLRRASIISGFNSFIWTERYSSYGDFQIVTISTPANRLLLSPGTMISMTGSYRIMVVDTVVDAVDDDGTANITVTGKSLEWLLNDRVAMPAIASTTATPNWVITGTPVDVALGMFDQICVETVLDPNDTIPFYHDGTLLPPGNLVPNPDAITFTFNPDTLYNSIQSICNTYGLGFRLVRNGDLGQVYFEVYTGNDLTTLQATLPAVVFDPNMGSLMNVSQLTSTASLKTVAYVFAQNGALIVMAPDTDPDESGADRHVLLVNSSNDGDAGDALIYALQQEGIAALAAQQRVYTIDGELPQQIPYIYGVDYNLGDLVEERTSDGDINRVVVTEQIFSSDDTGERAYPTLTQPGSTT